jgi:hypothetical protein
MNFAILLLAAVPLGAGAAPADWKSYLCKYGDGGTTRLIKVNEKDQRVLFEDKDADGVKISDKTIFFQPRSGGAWSIDKAGGKLDVIDIRFGARMTPGTCRVVDD